MKHEFICIVLSEDFFVYGN